ncbi:MAG: HAD family phosphatase [Bacteroidales bacterium]|nr:HAD family phosphatase [Bacteroidales bacterium]
MKNVIFDFGNVLVQWCPDRVYGEYFGNEARAWWFFRHVIDLEWRQRIDAGESQDKCIAELQAKHPEYAEAIALYRDRWREMLVGEVPGMRELIEELKIQRYEIYGLTNWSMETFPEAREHFGILQMIDRYVVSGAEGLVKPDPRLFQVLLDRYGLKAEECIFIDDNPDNVDAARQLGMEGIVFQGAEDLREKLRIKIKH